MIAPFQKVILSQCLILPLLWPAKKQKLITYGHLYMCFSKTHLINFLLKSQPNTPPSPIYLVPDTTSKLPSFCFLWEEVRKKCAEVLFFHQTRFIACLQWKALWFNTSVSSKDSSKIPYFPDFIMRSGCSTLYTFCEDCYTFIECLIRLTSCKCNSKDIHILACTRLPYPLNRQILILSTTLVSL